jgi:hypothetical protein
MQRSRIVVIALCGVLSLGGCGGDDDDGGDANSPDNRAGTPTATSGPEETATATPTPAPEDEAEEALATQTVKARGGNARSTTVDLAVQSLRVDGELATLTLAFTPHDPEAAPDTEYSIEDLHGGVNLFVSLVDTVNLKRYLVVEDSGQDRLETPTHITDVPLDATVTTEHTFAAPPAGVSEIDVSVGDWPPFRDVPIER